MSLAWRFSPNPLEQPVELIARVDAEFLIYLPHMRVNGAGGDSEKTGYGLHGIAASKPGAHVPLARRERDKAYTAA